MQCPQCKNEVPVTESQFGTLYTCPNCMASYFLGFDGLPEYGNMELPQVDAREEYMSSSSPQQTFETEYIFREELSGTVENTHEPDLEPANLYSIKPTFATTAQEITDYGNQEEVISSISYDLMIQGLDTKEVMQAFKDSIDDSKFAWLVQDILGQIKNGKVTLKNLNPIQAYVLANRIQFLDLEIDWKQNVAF